MYLKALEGADMKIRTKVALVLGFAAFIAAFGYAFEFILRFVISGFEYQSNFGTLALAMVVVLYVIALRNIRTLESL